MKKVFIQGLSRYSLRMPKLPEILSQREVARSRLFQVEARELRFSNGAVREYERLSANGGHGAVLVVPLLDAETLLLVREYAGGVHRYELALPKGLLEAGEGVEEAANRELMEETGYAARRIDPLRSLSIAPGYFAHQTRVVLARDLYPRRLEGDEPEEIEVVPWRIDEIPNLLFHDEFSEARSIAALMLAQEFLRGE